MSPGQMTRFIIGTVVVIVGAYYTTYFLAAKANGIQQGRTIQVLDRFSLAKDKTICAIKVGEKVYLVAMTGQAATLLDTLEGEAYESAGSKTANAYPISGAYGLLQNGLLKGAAMLKNGLFRKEGSAGDAITAYHKEEKPKTPVLQIASEEDDLDAVYRRIQARRARETKKQSPSFRGGHPE